MEIFPIILTVLFSSILSIKYLFTKIKHRVNPVLIGRNKKSFYVKILEITPIILTTILIVLSIANFLKNDINPNPILSYTGLVIGLSSFYFLILGYYHMGPSWRIGISNMINTPLVTTGIFSLTRNPVYIAFNLFALGIALTADHFIFFFLFSTILINLHLLILEEEKSLEKTHGEKYLKYKKKVPRYF